jgi:hypothetical protein
MIARIWRGSTRLADAEAYMVYLRRTGLAEYRATPGNAGAWVLWREVDGVECDPPFRTAGTHWVALRAGVRSGGG